jgi:hypothetical protein
MILQPAAVFKKKKSNQILFGSTPKHLIYLFQQIGKMKYCLTVIDLQFNIGILISALSTGMGCQKYGQEFSFPLGSGEQRN